MEKFYVYNLLFTRWTVLNEVSQCKNKNGTHQDQIFLYN